MSDKNDNEPSRKKFVRAKPIKNFTLLTNKQISDAVKHYDDPNSVKKRHKKPK